MSVNRIIQMIKVRYRKDPHMQNSTIFTLFHQMNGSTNKIKSMRKLKLTLTLTPTLTDTGGAVLTLMLGYITWQ